jgi:hypothetical protein
LHARRAFSLAPRFFDPGLSHQSRIALIAIVWLMGAELGLGLALGMIGPSTTVLLALVLVAPAALLIRPDQLVAVALLSLLFSRPLVELGAPETLNFVHFPLALLALVKLLEQQADEANGRLIAWLLVSLGVAVLSAVTSWEAFRPLVAWLTLAEPFIFFGLVGTLDEARRGRMRFLALVCCAVQIPFALVQFAQGGIGDGVQGTLMGQGGGHHVVGAIALCAGWSLLATGRRTLAAVSLGLALGALGVLADAKQVYGAFVLAVLIAGLLQIRGRAAGSSLLLPGMVLIATVYVSAQIYPPMQHVLSREIISATAADKYGKATEIVDEMGVGNMMLGLGAGNGLSRTALASVPGYGSAPPFLVGTEPAPLAIRELYGYDQIRASSVDSPFSSWLGIYTDTGLLGVAAYAGLVSCVVRALATASDAHRRSSYTLLVFAACLGVAFTWLEEPAFTVLLAVLIGTGVQRGASTGRRGPGAALQVFSRSLPSLRRSP